MEKFAPEIRLRDHVAELFGRKQCSQADMIEVMRLARLVIETHQLADSFPHASLYCDWVMHGEIDRHRLVIGLLEQINAAICDYDKTHNIAQVSALLSLATLRIELTAIFLSYKVKTELVDSFQLWNAFVGVLFHDLRNRPLCLPKKPSGKAKKAKAAAIDRMKGKWPPPRQGWARALYVTLERSQTSTSDVFFWAVELEAPFLAGAPGGALIIKSELQMTEPRANFKLP
jgi:hypothetical protein